MADPLPGGETPGAAATAEQKVETVPVTAPAATSSLQPTQTERDLAERAKKAATPAEMRAILAEAKALRVQPTAPASEAAKPPASPEPPAEPTPGEQPPAEPAAPAPEGEPPPAAEEPTSPSVIEDDDDSRTDGPVEPIKSAKVHLRFRPDDEVGRLAASFLKRNRDMTAEEAIAAAKEKLGIQAAPAQPEKPETPKSNLPETVEGVDEAIRKLRVERRRATVELKFEEASDYTDKLEDLQLHRQELIRLNDRKAAEAAVEYEESFTQSEQKAVDLYAFASDPNSEGGKRMKEIDRDLKATGNPLYEDPNKPLKIAMMVANELNIAPRRKTAPATPKPATPQPAPAQPQPKKQILPSGASRSATPTTPQQIPEVAKALEARTVAEIRAIHRKLGIPV